MYLYFRYIILLLNCINS